MQIKTNNYIYFGISLLIVIMTTVVCSAEELNQWASGATASSEYTADRWSANQATGAPNTDACGDISTAWAPASSGTDPEWLSLSFATPVLATAVRVHETNIAGFIYQVDVVDTSGQKHTVWAGTDSTACPGWLEVTFDKTQYTINGVILYTKIAGWEEIDAVELIGDTDTSTTTTVPSDTSPGTVSTTVSPRQWASGSTASSEYTADRWSANQATGVPNTDACGDISTAWAPASSGSDPEWLNLSFSTPVQAIGVRVHETNIAGFIYQVDVVDTSGQKHTVWTGTDSTVCPGWFEVTFDKTQYSVNGVILYTKIAGWEEVDAVELLGEGATETNESVPSSGPIITFESRTTPTGSTVQIPITLKGVTDNIGNMDLTLQYDPAVLDAKEVMNGPLTQSAIFDSNIVAGNIKVSLASSEGFGGDGVIAYVKFNVIGASGSSSALKITSVSANTAEDMQAITISSKDGLFKVIIAGEGSGDADGDGVYSARDALAALQMSVGKIDKQSFMDMNQDGEITSLDARMILQLAVK
ncbi:MAG: cohesin domain-containing protein [Methanomethylovorans sp.]|uniref:cohesin domain-containing protein n=1 Tax=Methanomethylovorans sp. TaxID=2758717 RepID=UPI003530D303